MKIFQIKKRSGGYRLIFAPNEEEKKEFRELLNQISQAHLKYAHAFISGRNIITNAMPHVGKKVTISFDLKDFFDHVTPDKVNGKVPQVVKEKCFIYSEHDNKKAARQGLPTSPALANIAGEAIDNAIVKALSKIDKTAVYTRYADDLSISTNIDDFEHIKKIKKIVSEVVNRCNFKINEKKIRVQHSRSGRREICGIMVDDTGIHVPRKIKRKIRAARHQYVLAVKSGDCKKAKKHANSLTGLLEFSMLKKPKELSKKKKTKENQYREAKIIAKAYKLELPQKVQKLLPEQQISENMFITNDPVYFYGMSVFTTGWTSCMSITKKDSSYHKGVSFWQRHPGVSLAIWIDPNKTVTIAGVKRPAMIARCLVYQLRDGRKCYGDIYSKQGHRIDREHPLAKALEKVGFIPATKARHTLVSSNVKIPIPLPYFDNCEAEPVKLKNGKKAYRLKIE